MAQKDPSHDIDSEGLVIRLKTAAALLGIYTAMHLAVGAVVRVLTPQEATAALAPHDSTMSSAATDASACPVDSTETSAGDSFRRASAAAALAAD